MTVAFYVYNEVENSTITASSENASFPLSNLTDHRRTKTFRSLTNSDSVLFDLGSIRPIDSIFVVDHSLNGFNLSSITAEFNNTNNWISPPLSVVVPIDYKNGKALIEFPQVNYRYVRLVLTSTTGFCELAKLFIGAKNQYASTDFSYPLDYSVDDLAIITKNRYGQKFIDEVSSQKIISGRMDYIPQVDIDDILDWLEFISVTRPMFISFSNALIANDVFRFSGYYFLKSEPKLQLTGGNFWSLTLTLEEAL